jgi:hypothetical protein
MWMSPVYPLFRKRKIYEYLCKLEGNRWVIWQVQKGDYTPLRSAAWIQQDVSFRQLSFFHAEIGKNELTDDASLGTLGISHETGWMTGEAFLQWLKHFSLLVKPSQEDKVLPTVDGHSSCKHVDVLSVAKENCIVMYLPPHCRPIHRLQPLRVIFWANEDVLWSRSF